MDFTLNAIKYDIKISRSACGDFYVGQKLQLRYLEGYEDNFLFPNETPIYTDLFLAILLFGLAVWCVYYVVKN
jgi:hypothetical protein